MTLFSRMDRSPNTRKGSERSDRPAGRRLQTIAVLLLLAVTLAADQAVTIRGEIVDSYCYAGRGIHGPDHTACALRCARKGMPLVLIEDGSRRVYQLMPARDETAMPENVIAAAGTVRTITGRVFVNSGARYLMVDAMK
jgi:hypothetical protein